MRKKLTSVMAIGGSDPVCGAGIQADVRTISSLGLHPLCVVTAITAQNSHGVSRVDAVNKESFRAQMDAILEDVIPDALKIGMTGSETLAREIAEFCRKFHKILPMVVDPVFKASTGGILLDSKGKNNSESTQESIINIYIKDIFPYCTLITPNTSETEILLKKSEPHIAMESLSQKEKAKILVESFEVTAAVVKGGDCKGDSITDVLAYRIGESIIYKEFSHKRIECINLHGTGCVFSSILASLLALNQEVEEAFVKSSIIMEKIIGRSLDYELGYSTYGPLNINQYV